MAIQPDENDPKFLARLHTPEAIGHLARIMKLGGRQASAAVSAARAIISIAYPEHDEEKVRELVEKKLHALIAEAERREAERQRLGPAGVS